MRLLNSSTRATNGGMTASDRLGWTDFLGHAARHVVRSAGGQGSHQLAGLAAANALAVLPDGDGVPAGGDVDVLLLG